MFDIQHQQPRNVQPPSTSSISRLLAEEGSLDVAWLTEHAQFEQNQRDVRGVTREVVPGPEQEVDGGLELSSQEQNLEVEDGLGTGGEMSLA